MTISYVKARFLKQQKHFLRSVAVKIDNGMNYLAKRSLPMIRAHHCDLRVKEWHSPLD